MWLFNLFKKKKKVQPAEEKSLPMDCIFNSIVSDLDEKRIKDWKYQYSGKGWEYFNNLKKGYKLNCYSGDSTGWLSPFSFHDCFTNKQQRIIFEKCQEIWILIAEKRKEEERQQHEETIKSLFPDCFPKA